MHFSMNRETLLKPLQLVGGAIGSRPTIPILSNILVVIKDGFLFLTGTDMEVELVASLAISSDYSEGEITIPARKFVDICRGLPDGCEISCKADDNRLVVRSGRSRFSLATLPASDYPNIEDWNCETNLQLLQGQLKQLIEKTQFSMASQDVRYYLNGMLFETDGGTLKTVATDGHRLALAELKIDADLPQNQVIVPRKGVLELQRLLENESESIELQIGDNNLRAIVNGYSFTTKLVDGRFPDYRRVVPRGSDKLVISGREELRQAFARAAILSNEKFRGVRVVLSSGLLNITANNPEQEEAEEVVDVAYEGEDLEIGFNVSYVLDVLNTLKCEQVKFSMSNSNSSALIEDNTEHELSSAMYVVMPMRL
ncbi:DNA polymerase III subunit beta [Alginatibacterium sediminis]|uniref:Beta sliding clamp n=1 Tax=Alginatibacterium sediminis TaxID=2164068 RepID=A0A420ENG0_9ALTE|nr:DNA polymerase III subunit beta [Alginatibacterium sediminis]RKF22259.1 DNA polymerase III subunit beta [Alginatibacterium sediminis]